MEPYAEVRMMEWGTVRAEGEGKCPGQGNHMSKNLGPGIMRHMGER